MSSLIMVYVLFMQITQVYGFYDECLRKYVFTGLSSVGIIIFQRPPMAQLHLVISDPFSFLCCFYLVLL